MKRFSAKTIARQSSFGEILRLTREKHGWSLDQVSFNIKIPISYLLALEQESLADLPSGLYGQKFLREYALFLSLEPELLLAEYYDRQNNLYRPAIKRTRADNNWLTWPWFRFSLIGLAIILFIYLIWEAGSLFLPPPLNVLNPPADTVTESLAINVIGRTDPGVRVTLNNESVTVTADGYFRQEVVLQPGLNTIEVSASRLYSHPTKVIRQVLASGLPKN